MQSDGEPLVESDFDELSQLSTLLASQYIEGGQEFQTSRQVEIAWIDNLVLPLFITTVVIYSLSIISLVLSIVNVSCILKT